MAEQKKSAELVQQAAAPASAYRTPVDREAIRRLILGNKPSEALIANAKRVLTVLAIHDAAGAKIDGEPSKGTYTITLTRKSDGRGIHELLDLCHALWPDSAFSAKDN
jgi:hypothetical protein